MSLSLGSGRVRVPPLEPVSVDQFRYMANPSAGSPPADAPCGLCGTDRDVRVSGFAGARDIDAICLRCIAAGLPDDVAMGRDGDGGALRKQLRALHPDWTDAQLAADAAEKIRELAHRTPTILSWQEWFWPACCGDFCSFLQHAGQADLDGLAAGFGVEDGRALLAAGLIDETLQPASEVWRILPTASQSPESNDSPQAYVFQCRHCRRARIEWDCH